MTDDIQGGCKCGLVRFSGVRADKAMFRCHCRDCQQLTGTGHADLMPLVAASFEISDVSKTYEMTGGSGKPTYSGFCPNCGSQLTRQSVKMREFIYIHAAALDDPSRYVPAKSIFLDDVHPWDAGSVVGED